MPQLHKPMAALLALLLFVVPASKSTWLNHDGGGPDDAFNDVTALADGTFVAVGGLRDGSKRYGWRVRFDADGKTQCGN
ncbi:MAG: hypothetical protein H6747_02095 [Deltaproteobacteria bacterium]|nr:hypothetical protein [Deltaproteobacteria bacterium]